MRRFLCVIVSAALAAVGCGKANGPVEVHLVKGQVVYDGKPAAGVQVFFVPMSAPTVPRIPANPHGVTGADGAFTLTTYQPGDGAADGGYQVVLLWPQDAKGDEEGSDVDRLLGWYGPVHSKLTAQVQPGPNVLPPFKLAAVTRPPEAVQGIPGKN
jgi:hypothetical protein